LRRRKWVVVVSVLAAPAAAFALTHGKPPRYVSTSTVLLNQQSISAALTNTTDPTSYLQPDRRAQTEVDLAREGTVASAVVAAAARAMRAAGGAPGAPEKFLHGARAAAGAEAARP